jgi:hypothetical protein
MWWVVAAIAGITYPAALVAYEGIVVATVTVTIRSLAGLSGTGETDADLASRRGETDCR